MRKGDREVGFNLIVLLLASIIVGMLFWGIRFANAWDANVGRMIATLDALIERAYGISTPQQ